MFMDESSNSHFPISYNLDIPFQWKNSLLPSDWTLIEKEQGCKSKLKENLNELQGVELVC